MLGLKEVNASSAKFSFGIKPDIKKISSSPGPIFIDL